MACHFALWWAIGHPVSLTLECVEQQQESKVVTQDEPPTFSGDMKKKENVDAWLELFEAIDPILHAVNCVSECLDFDTMGRYV